MEHGRNGLEVGRLGGGAGEAADVVRIGVVEGRGARGDVKHESLSRVLVVGDRNGVRRGDRGHTQERVQGGVDPRRATLDSGGHPTRRLGRVAIGGVGVEKDASDSLVPGEGGNEGVAHSHGV